MSMVVGVIDSIQIGLPQTFGDVGQLQSEIPSWTSGIMKHLVTGDVRVGRLQLDGDGQADRKHHGGPDKVVLAYAADHYSIWRRELPQIDFANGAFGENLTIRSGYVMTCCKGNVWQIGD